MKFEAGKRYITRNGRLGIIDLFKPHHHGHADRRIVVYGKMRETPVTPVFIKPGTRE
jgi:hypothetical protein